MNTYCYLFKSIRPQIFADTRRKLFYKFLIFMGLRCIKNLQNLRPKRKFLFYISKIFRICVYLRSSAAKAVEIVKHQNYVNLYKKVAFNFP